MAWAPAGRQADPTVVSTVAGQAERFGLSVEGYCLMSNHVHLVARPADDQALAKAVGQARWLYTQYVDRGRVLSEAFPIHP